MMIKRESLKEQIYFDEKVEYRKKIIIDFNEIISKQEISDVHRRRLKYSVFIKALELWVLRYSQGESIEILKKEFPEIIIFLEEYKKEPKSELFNFKQYDHYVIALWLISISILIDLEEFDKLKLLDLIGNEGQDILYEFIASNIVSGRKKTEKVIHNLPFKFIGILHKVEKKGQQNALIHKYLDEWYKNFKRAWFHGSHKKDDSGFFGYWCFELAVLVKILKLDDLSFADHILYPRDLTGKEILRTWDDSKIGEIDRNKLNEQKKK